MQPVGEQFRRRLRNFPAVVNCTTIDWFQSWPEDALNSTAYNFLKTKFPEEISNENKLNLARVAVETHVKICDLTEQYYQELRKHFYVTPT